VLPDYVPKAGIPKPDLPGSDIISAAYLKFPEPFNSYDGKPLNGETVTNMTIIYIPPIPPVSKNKWWQELNKKAGGTIESDMVPNGSWLTKQAAVIAGGSIPDMMIMTGALKSFPQLLEAKFTDLTPYLSGSNIRKYQNLASIPTICWKNSMLNGKIWGIPIQRPICNNAFEYRADYLKAAGLAVPKNADEFTEIAKALTNPKKNRWAVTSGTTGGPYMNSFFFQMFKCSNGWKADKNGKFTYYIEDPGAIEAMNLMRKFQQNGYFFPNPPSSGNNVEKANIQSGKIFIYGDGITGLNQNYLSGRLIDKNIDIQCMVAPAHDGSKSIYWNGSALFGLFNAFSNNSKVSVESRLRLCDWHASQYGSKQNVFIGDGIKGVDYTLKGGVPTPTQQGSTDSAGTTISYLSGPPFVFINSIPEATKAQYAFSVATSKVGINDDSLGLYSATNSGNGASLGTMLTDAMTGIVLGREPVSSWKDTVSKWRQQGGDKIRSEFEAAYAQANG